MSEARLLIRIKLGIRPIRTTNTLADLLLHVHDLFGGNYNDTRLSGIHTIGR